MARIRWRVRLRSWFDATMDRGTPALVAWLGLASLILIAVVTALVVLLTPVEDHLDGGWPSVLWKSLLRTLDPGTMGGDAGSPVFLALMLTVTIGGIFIVSALIGVLTTGLEARISELRKGRSPVIARGHTVLLGWSDQVFTIVTELVKANQANRPGCGAAAAWPGMVLGVATPWHDERDNAAARPAELVCLVPSLMVAYAWTAPAADGWH
jgi:hypothetical protein